MKSGEPKKKQTIREQGRSSAGVDLSRSRPLAEFIEETAHLPPLARLSEDARALITAIRAVPATTRNDRKVTAHLAAEDMLTLDQIAERYGVTRTRIIAFSIRDLVRRLRAS